jgi:hypothetical protein
MKKLIALLAGGLLFASTNFNTILPKNFGECVQLGYFDIQNPPISLNDFFLVIKKYDCNNKIIYLGIEDRIPGILKLNVNNDTKDFLLKHFKINGFDAAVYIDKNLKEGVIAIKLTDKYALKVLFNGTDYKSVVDIIKNLDLEKIKAELS